jgi:hypothetical protein
MKKLFILLIAAALIGIVISRGRHDALPAAQTADDPGLARQAGTMTAAAEAPAPSPAATVAQAAATAETEPAVTKPAPAPAEPAKLAQAQPERSDSPPLLSAVTLLPTGALAVQAPAPAAALSPAQSDALLQAGDLLKAGKRVEARALLTPLYLQAGGQRAAQLRAVLDAINRDLVFNPRCTDGATVYTVESGDVGVHIARKLGVSWGMIARLNGLGKDAVLHVGQKLKVLEGKPSIVVNRDQFRLALLWNGVYVKEYAVGIGTAGSATPLGEFTVKDMVIHAPWTNPQGAIVKYGEPDYPLGERWIGFADEPGASGIGIHGTNDENSIGTMCSSGCLRMHNADVLELYDFVTAGTHVTIQE